MFGLYLSLSVSHRYLSWGYRRLSGFHEEKGGNKKASGSEWPARCENKMDEWDTLRSTSSGSRAGTYSTFLEVSSTKQRPSTGNLYHSREWLAPPSKRFSSGRLSSLFRNSPIPFEQIGDIKQIRLLERKQCSRNALNETLFSWRTQLVEYWQGRGKRERESNELFN